MWQELKIRAGAEGFGAMLVWGSFGPIPSHHHDELEVNLVLSGKASYLFGNRRLPLRANSMLWLFPEQEHVLMDWSHDFSMWVLFFKPSLVDRHTRTGTRRILRSRDPGEIFSRQIDSRRVDLLHQVYEDASGVGDPELDVINAALGYALVASWRAYQFSSDPLSRIDVHPAVGKAARLISDAEDSPALEPLAREAGLSPARLSRLFKRQTGISLTAFRQRKCLERFLRLYRRGARYTLIEAALQAGFGSYAQFHRVFCREMRMNPAAYRRSFAGDEREESVNDSSREKRNRRRSRRSPA